MSADNFVGILATHGEWRVAECSASEDLRSSLKNCRRAFAKASVFTSHDDAQAAALTLYHRGYFEYGIGGVIDFKDRFFVPHALGWCCESARTCVSLKDPVALKIWKGPIWVAISFCPFCGTEFKS